LAVAYSPEENHKISIQGAAKTFISLQLMSQGEFFFFLLSFLLFSRFEFDDFLPQTNNFSLRKARTQEKRKKDEK
jgi:hypothetical protein